MQAASPLDLEPHLSLVSHVVRQLSVRVPRNVSRGQMWTLGAVGLAVAARHHAQVDDGGAFGTHALRAVRTAILDGLRRGAPLPTDADLAAQLGTTVDVVLAHRGPLEASSATLPAAAPPLAPRTHAAATPPAAALGGRRAPAWIGATA